MSTWFTGGCDFQWNVPPRLEVVPNGLTARLFDSRTRLCRGSMSSDLDQMAVTLISFAVQSSLPLLATCRPAAGRACSTRFHLHVKEMRTRGTWWHGRWESDRFGYGLDPVISMRQLIVEIEQSVCLLAVHRVPDDYRSLSRTPIRALADIFDRLAHTCKKSRDRPIYAADRRVGSISDDERWDTHASGRRTHA